MHSVEAGSLHSPSIGIRGLHKQTHAIIFDLDGVLLDSESAWEDERRRFVAQHGGRWRSDSQQRLMGMSTAEWAAYLHGDLGVSVPAQDIVAGVLNGMKERYQRQLPMIPGARPVVRRLARRWPLGLASSSPRSLIEFVLERAQLAPFFQAVVSSDEVARGKPAPDVYLAAAKRMDIEAGQCAAVEDSGNGLRAAAAAGMRVVAIPNAHYPPDAAALDLASLVLEKLAQLTPASIEALPA
jgi:HAD superfamily hydrolase (TIGR01509 family)